MRLRQPFVSSIGDFFAHQHFQDLTPGGPLMVKNSYTNEWEFPDVDDSYDNVNEVNNFRFLTDTAQIEQAVQSRNRLLLHRLTVFDEKERSQESLTYSKLVPLDSNIVALLNKATNDQMLLQPMYESDALSPLNITLELDDDQLEELSDRISGYQINDGNDSAIYGDSDKEDYNNSTMSAINDAFRVRTLLESGHQFILGGKLWQREMLSTALILIFTLIALSGLDTLSACMYRNILSFCRPTTLFVSARKAAESVSSMSTMLNTFIQVVMRRKLVIKLLALGVIYLVSKTVAYLWPIFLIESQLHAGFTRWKKNRLVVPPP
jgi:hypothetical protein